MAARSRQKQFGARFHQVDLSDHLNWPRRVKSDPWWQQTAERVRAYPEGNQQSWGIPFAMAGGSGPRVVIAGKGRKDVTIKLGRKADFVCLLHEWHQMAADTNREDPHEGLAVGEYELTFSEGTTHVQPVRGRFEVALAESPGPPWLAVPFRMWEAIDPVHLPPDCDWARGQRATTGAHGSPLLYALQNPCPEKTVRSLTVRGLLDSPLVVAALTLYQGAGHPLQHLPRRVYQVQAPGSPTRVEEAHVDLGGVTRVERTGGPRGKAWLESPVAGLFRGQDPPDKADDVIHAFGADDATVEVTLEGRRTPVKLSLGEAFHKGVSSAQGGKVKLKPLDGVRQWLQVTVTDSSTGKPTPVRIHFSGPRGEYYAPYGHHQQINPGWFMDYGADVIAGGRSYAYVDGEFTTDLPVGDLYVEINKGFEYKPVRKKVTVRPGQRKLNLTVDRALDWRTDGWVTADTHVHFISPQTAWLEGQAEGVNVVNLLASQWGRLFTNVGDLSCRVGVAEDDTIVYVGTENRNHMLGHMSMLGTRDMPVYPMCCGGPGEAFLGDPDFRTLAEWALENKRKGGVVIRPHYPFCGHTEDPVPILAGLVDALEIGGLRGEDFPTQEWYRYLNCGYRVAVAGGTDKMGAHCAVGWMRTYALLDNYHPLTYDAWGDAVRAGRTFSTTGPLIDLKVDGHLIGDTIEIGESGATLEIEANAESYWPLGKLELVHNGHAVAVEHDRQGAKTLKLRTKLSAAGPGWIAARCSGHPKHPGGYIAAHTSPVYLKRGDERLFDGPAAEHMLALVEGGTEYLNTLATAFDKPSRKRMVKLFNEARRELKGRLLVEQKPVHNHGSGPYHTHGHGEAGDHTH